MKRAPRTNIRKTRLNDTENRNFGRACAIAKTTAGKQIRSLINSWSDTKVANDMGRKGYGEGPAFQINRPFIFPCRVNYGAVPRVRMNC